MSPVFKDCSTIRTPKMLYRCHFKYIRRASVIRAEYNRKSKIFDESQNLLYTERSKISGRPVRKSCVFYFKRWESEFHCVIVLVLQYSVVLAMCHFSVAIRSMTSTTFVSCRIHWFVIVSLIEIPNMIRSITLWATLILLAEAFVNVIFLAP